ncbi:putative degT/DnrJ/EryC1/StrS aminotransferase, pyridoxal phosphate-dependent transferase [Plasmopara halstedii]
MSRTRTARLKPFGQFESLSASVPWAIFPRKKLDVTYSDIRAGLIACLQLNEHQREEYEEKVTKNGIQVVIRWLHSPFGSVELLLQTLKFPRGSEVICSSITIPDMVYILRYHGLVPIPVDLSPATLAIDGKELEKAITKKTKMILIAHIFGSRDPLDEILQIAQQRHLLVVEDGAQAFMGKEYTATSFGGALIYVKNITVLDEMRRRERRLIKYSVLHGLSTPALYGLFLHACRVIGADHDQVITSAIRGLVVEN